MPNSLNFSPDSDASLLNKKNDKPSVSGDFFVMEHWKNISLENIGGEEWKDIDGADGYQISNMGRIKSLNQYGITGRDCILKQREARKNTYLKIDLDKYNTRPSVHRLVAFYFVENLNNYPCVLHRDSNKQNNRFDNLEWGTRSKNRNDYIEYTNRYGISRKKMSKDKVLCIYKDGDTVQSISIKHDIAPSTVWMIKTGYRWSKVTGHECTDKRYI